MRNKAEPKRPMAPSASSAASITDMPCSAGKSSHGIPTVGKTNERCAIHGSGRRNIVRIALSAQNFTETPFAQHIR